MMIEKYYKHQAHKYTYTHIYHTDHMEGVDEETKTDETVPSSTRIQDSGKYNKPKPSASIYTYT